MRRHRLTTPKRSGDDKVPCHDAGTRRAQLMRLSHPKQLRTQESMPSDFSYRITGSNPHRDRSQSWRAGQIAIAMEGCRIESVICALRSFERDETPKGIGDPARWLSHFAGLESGDSGKETSPWIEISLAEKSIRSLSAYREALASRRELQWCK
jgi:hypothetical protein